MWGLEELTTYFAFHLGMLHSRWEARQWIDRLTNERFFVDMPEHEVDRLRAMYRKRLGELPPIWEYLMPLYPLSLNNIYANVPRRGRVPTARLIAYKKMFKANLGEFDRARNRLSPRGYASWSAYWYFWFPDLGDLDNCIKAPQDSLMEYIGVNDKNIRHFNTLRYRAPKTQAHTMVVLEPFDHDYYANLYPGNRVPVMAEWLVQPPEESQGLDNGRGPTRANAAESPSESDSTT